jgi:MFS family permease
MSFLKCMSLITLYINNQCSVYSFIYIFSPSNILCKRFGPKIWLSLIAFCFGLMTMCLSTTQSYPGMIVVRTFMGSAEAGIMPAISYMLSTL